MRLSNSACYLQWIVALALLGCFSAPLASGGHGTLSLLSGGQCREVDSDVLVCLGWRVKNDRYVYLKNVGVRGLCKFEFSSTKYRTGRDFYQTISNKTNLGFKEFRIRKVGGMQLGMEDCLELVWNDGDTIELLVNVRGGMRAKVAPEKKKRVAKKTVEIDEEEMRADELVARVEGKSPEKSEVSGEDGMIPEEKRPEERSETSEEDERRRSGDSGEEEVLDNNEEIAVALKYIIQELKFHRKKSEELERAIAEIAKSKEEEKKRSLVREDVTSPFKSGRKNTTTTNNTTTTSTTTTTTTTTTAKATTNNNNNNTNMNSREIKSVKLKDFPEYDGKTDFREWYKRFNVKMNAGNYCNRTRLVTLLDYLSKDINEWLQELDEDTLTRYESVVEILREEYEEKEAAESDMLQRLLAIKMGEDEAVTTYAARVAAAKNRCPGQVSNSLLVNVFLDGLHESIQESVRNEVREKEDDINVVLKIARKKELNSRRTKTATCRHGSQTGVNSSNKSNNTNTPTLGKCLVCNIAAPPKGKMICSVCFAKAKAPSVPNVSNVNTAGMSAAGKKCSSCKVNDANPGRGWCQGCFDSKKGGSKSSNINNSTINTPPSNTHTTNPVIKDFSKMRVKYNVVDDNSSNPFLWSNEKILKERLCFYCTNAMSGHGSTPCKDRYVNYQSAEVRALLEKKMSVPDRTVRPTGPPISP